MNSREEKICAELDKLVGSRVNLEVIIRMEDGNEAGINITGTLYKNGLVLGGLHYLVKNEGNIENTFFTAGLVVSMYRITRDITNICLKRMVARV